MNLASLDGLGEERADFRAGQICATLANIHRKEDTPPFRPSDFIPELAASAAEEEEALLLPDPEAHSRVIMQGVFGMEDA